MADNTNDHLPRKEVPVSTGKVELGKVRAMENGNGSAGQAALPPSHLGGHQHLGITNSKVSKITNPSRHLVN